MQTTLHVSQFGSLASDVYRGRFETPGVVWSWGYSGGMFWAECVEHTSPTMKVLVGEYFQSTNFTRMISDVVQAVELGDITLVLITDDTGDQVRVEI